MNRRVLLLSCALLIAPVTFAEEVPLLGEAIALALAHSPEVAMAQARVSHADAQLHSARWGWFHPEVRVYAGDNALNGATRAGIQVSQDVMRLLTLNHDEVRNTEHALTLARQELALTKDTLIRQVAETRLRLHRLEQAARLNTQLVAHHDAMAILAQTAFEQGSVPLERMLTTQDALLQAQQTLTQTQAELQSVRVVWAQLLGEPLPADGHDRPPSTVDSPPTIEGVGCGRWTVDCGRK